MNGRVVTRYPPMIRVGMLLVCAVLAIGLTRGSVHPMTVIVAFAAVCLTVAVLAYRTEINEKEVSVRYVPFFTRHIPLREIINLVEGKTLILITATSRVPLWGLSDKARGVIFQILPRHLDVLGSQSESQKDSVVSIRKHRRFTIVAAVGFLVMALSVVPFFKGNALHDYWSSAGQYLLLMCLLFFIAFVFEAGFTWVLWSTKREVDEIARRSIHRRQ
jgi:hypothetical protein